MIPEQQPLATPTTMSNIQPRNWLCNGRPINVYGSEVKEVFV